MIRNAEFTNIRNEFRDHLNRDIESIRSTKNVLVFADKSTNLYELSRENYQKLLHENITQTHKKAPKNAKQDIDRKTKSFVKTLKIEDRMECYSNQHAYITLKDHKENFRNNTKCRLINPFKIGVGVAEFYLSISENLLNKSIAYANSFTKTEDNAINAIKLARKSLLFNKDGTWVKKGDDTLFDVIMGSFDGAEISELIGLYLLDKLSSSIGRKNEGFTETTDSLLLIVVMEL